MTDIKGFSHFFLCQFYFSFFLQVHFESDLNMLVGVKLINKRYVCSFRILIVFLYVNLIILLLLDSPISNQIQSFHHFLRRAQKNLCNLASIIFLHVLKIITFL